MKARNRFFVAACAAFVMAMAMMQGAQAQCGLSMKAVKPMGWHLQDWGGRPMLRFADFDEGDHHEASIVGMWHVIFTAETMNNGPFSGVIDNAVAVWHPDGTEIMNSGRPAQDGNFCLGVWERTGKFMYYLNHIPWQGNDTTNAPSGIGNPSGGSQILERVALNPDGNSYSGTFKLTSYDTSGNATVTFTGKVKAMRITPRTSIKELF